MDAVLELGKGINGESLDQPKTTEEWFNHLLYSINEDLLSQTQVDSLLSNPMEFLEDFVGDAEKAIQIYDQVIRSFFVAQMEIKNNLDNPKKVLEQKVHQLITDRLNDSDKLSISELVEIYTTLK